MNQQLKVKTNLPFSGFQLWWWLSLARDFLFAFARDKAAFMGMERELKEKFPFRWWRTGSFPLTSKSKGSQGKSFCFSCWQFLNSSLVLLEIWAPCRALLPFFRPTAYCLPPTCQPVKAGASLLWDSFLRALKGLQKPSRWEAVRPRLLSPPGGPWASGWCLRCFEASGVEAALKIDVWNHAVVSVFFLLTTKAFLWFFFKLCRFFDY